MSPYKTVKSDITQKQWLKACKKLGLEVDKTRGNGSHARVYKPDDPSGAPITIQNHIHKCVSRGIYRSLMDLGFTEEEIDKALKIKK